jgi:hypothetical protein
MRLESSAMTSPQRRAKISRRPPLGDGAKVGLKCLEHAQRLLQPPPVLLRAREMPGGEAQGRGARMGDRDVKGENGERRESGRREERTPGGTNGRMRLPSAPTSERASEREKGIWVYMTHMP